jgi:hypothetical protein
MNFKLNQKSSKNFELYPYFYFRENYFSKDFQYLLENFKNKLLKKKVSNLV